MLMHAVHFLFQLSIWLQVPDVDRSLTSWSCSVDTLLSGKDCVFEFEANPVAESAELKRQNVLLARQLAPAACARALRPTDERLPDQQLLELCERDFAVAAKSCALDGKWPLLDTQQRFAPSARACYLALAGVLQRTMMAAALYSDCCECLLSSSCSTAMQCYQHLEGGAATASEFECMRGACSDHCENALISSQGAIKMKRAQ